MTTLQKLEDKIKELVPEIMGLDFGCEVTHSGRDCLYECVIPNGKIVSAYVPDGQTWTYYKLDTGDEICAETLYCCGKILGRPIQLADIILAVGDKISHDKTIYENIMTLLYYDKTDYCNVVHWDLKKPLSQQLQEVHEFLLEVLS